MAPVTLLEPVPTLHADSPSSSRPARAALLRLAAGYLVLTGVMLAVGMLLTHALDGTVGRWDEHVNQHFAAHRTDGWNQITKIATASFNTLPVVGAAVLIVGYLALRRYWREAAFLTMALVLEITVFLSVTFVVARPRPDVPRLNATPATSSFPSGHTAAAMVLFVSLAIIITCRTHSRIARLLGVLLATLVVTAVAFARVYRGLHHPTDVFAGALFGLACVFVAATAVRAGSMAADRRRIVPGEPFRTSVVPER
jgi:membrane-associated phospholipid phosphatase